MFCVSCGKPIPAGSRFCNACGAEQPARAMPESGARSDFSDAEREIFKLQPTLRFIVFGYLLAGVIALVCAALIAMSPFRSFGIVLAAAAVLLAVPGWFHLKRESEVYRLTDRKIEIRYGLLSRTVRNIPLASVQDVTATATIGERLLGIGNIEIDSASEAGKIFLRKVPHPTRHAEEILAQLRRRN